jgi:RNA polymerase sigma-70 factor (ECF subfamily)
MDKQDSSVLLQQARAGSPDAINALFSQCGEHVLAFIRPRLGPGLRAHLESGDILQVTLLRAFTHLEQFEGDGSRTLVAWLTAIAQNVIRNEAEYARRVKRDAGRTVPLSEEAERVPGDLGSQANQLILKEETRRLKTAMESLDPIHRQVILLRKYEEFSFQEIAVRLGRSPDACRMLLARALTTLAERMRTSPGHTWPGSRAPAGRSSKAG